MYVYACRYYMHSYVRSKIRTYIHTYILHKVIYYYKPPYSIGTYVQHIFMYHTTYPNLILSKSTILRKIRYKTQSSKT